MSTVDSPFRGRGTPASPVDSSHLAGAKIAGPAHHLHVLRPVLRERDVRCFLGHGDLQINLAGCAAGTRLSSCLWLTYVPPYYSTKTLD